MTEIIELDRLILKYLSGELTETEQEELFRWRDASDRNREIFARLTNTEWLGAQLERLNLSGEDAAWAKLQALKKNQPGTIVPIKQKRRFMWAAAIAIFIVIAAVVAWWITQSSPSSHKNNLTQEPRLKNDVQPGREGAVLTLADGTQMLLDSVGNGLLKNQAEAQVLKEDGQLQYTVPADAEVKYHTLSTPRGRTFKLVLADGTTAWLNAASSITFPTAFNRATREVQVKGEVYFDVIKTGKPFFATMDGMKIEVLGTRFNMNGYGDAGLIKTTLVEGSIRASGTGNIKGELLLVPGQEAFLQSGENHLEKRTADLEETIAWTDHLFVFNNVPIRQVMQQLERWYDLDIDFKDTVEQHFSGTIPMNVTISKVLELLELTKGVRFLVDGKKVTVMKY